MSVFRVSLLLPFSGVGTSQTRNPFLGVIEDTGKKMSQKMICHKTGRLSTKTTKLKIIYKEFESVFRYEPNLRWNDTSICRLRGFTSRSY